MSGEPKTLTPAEALRRLREEGMELTFDSNDATPWAVYRERGGTLPEYLHFGQTQEEVLSAALGVPIVARDEAAELRAENAELRAAGHQSVRLIEWLSSREGTALEDAAEAEALVNRLRAALAASEGES